jgi:hypothetical protein
MKLTTLLIPALALAGAAFAANRPSGEKAEHEFRDAPVNSKGIKSMADLRGKPVVIDFWGIN